LPSLFKNSEETTQSIIETIESIKENSIGFVNGLELLTNFDVDEGKRVLFVYCKEIKKD
jgi:hypothetical protein